MQKYQLTITAYYELGILERILRVIRHRGGYIHQMQMEELPEQKLSLNFVLSSHKEKSILVNQIAKLADIITLD